jgi:hypothetical protein
MGLSVPRPGPFTGRNSLVILGLVIAGKISVDTVGENFAHGNAVSQSVSMIRTSFCFELVSDVVMFQCFVFVLVSCFALLSCVCVAVLFCLFLDCIFVCSSIVQEGRIDRTCADSVSSLILTYLRPILTPSL